MNSAEGVPVNNIAFLLALSYKATSNVSATKHSNPLEAAAWEKTRAWLLDLAQENWYPGNGDQAEGISY